jgi:hypothetical protein
MALEGTMNSSKFTSPAAWAELLLHVENLFFYCFAPFLIQVVVIVCLIGIGQKYLKETNNLALPISVTFAIAGIVLGYFVGASRESVIAALVPAVLTLIGGIAAYVFSKDGLLEIRTVAGYGLAALLLGALSGTVHGQSVRAASLAAEAVAQQQRDEATRRYEEWKLNYEKVELPLRLENLRKQLGLPATSPTPSSPQPSRTPG